MKFYDREYNYPLAFVGEIIITTATYLDGTKKADTVVVLPMLIVGCAILFLSRKRVKKNEAEHEGEIKSN